MTSNPIVWFEIYVQDLARAKKFYESVLATNLEILDSPDPNMEMLVFPMQKDGAGAGGALVTMHDGPKPGGGTIVYFRSQDCAVEAGRVASNGGKLVKGKFAIGKHGHIALASDPDGNTIGFHSAPNSWSQSTPD